MKKIITKISRCDRCPYYYEERTYAQGSLGIVYKWICKKKRKTINGYVKSFDKIKIPDWCPLEDY